ncbi:hypothetical protein B0H16DRAFT_1468276 [Mycena metata]|uniref:Uncharacterized protein n=1 Tax=Mycena metata TaxID=1033252 RepID=A0AAD7MU11_9AGAR|nr:hypothetical protein B0H16DRAFT_1468276 [Mycena metata]
MFSLLLLLTIPSFFHFASALLNVTIDDTDSAIVYQGSWEASSTHLSSLDYGGSHTVSGDSTASATLTFTGVAIYYLCPRWPYAVNTEVTLDGGQSVIINLTDPIASTTAAGGSESAPFSVVWSATGLTNTTHKLVLTMAPTGEFLVADGFIFTVNNGSSASSSSGSQTASKTPSASTAASSAGSSVVPGKQNTLAIAIGSALGAAAIIAAIGVAFCIYRRRNNRHRRVSNVLDESDADAYPPPPAPFLAGAAHPPTHRAQMSDASTGPLLATSWDRPTSEYRPMSEYHDNPPTTMTSMSAYSVASGLPPGARLADPAAYVDDPNDLASGSSSIARTASSSGLLAGAAFASARREKERPLREETHTPAPPAYSES